MINILGLTKEDCIEMLEFGLTDMEANYEKLFKENADDVETHRIVHELKGNTGSMGMMILHEHMVRMLVIYCNRLKLSQEEKRQTLDLWNLEKKQLFDQCKALQKVTFEAALEWLQQNK